MDVVLVLGVPGSGKTTLVRELLAGFGEAYGCKCGLVTAQVYPAVQVMVLGDYSQDTPFAGTDRWSMASQRDVPRWVQLLQKEQGYWDNWTILGEGARITTLPFITQIAKLAKPTFTFLYVDSTVLQARRTARSNQSERWLRGMDTRIANMHTHVAEIGTCIDLPNTTKAEHDQTVAHVWSLVAYPR